MDRRAAHLGGQALEELANHEARRAFQHAAADGSHLAADLDRIGVGDFRAAVGGRMLEGAARILVKQFFERLAAQIGGAPTAAAAPRWQWWRRLLAWLGGAS